MSLQEKQNYLRTQIVQKNYNAQKFYDFWQTYNLDLQDASMNDLISVVQLFIQQQHHQQNIQQTNQQDDDQFGDYVQIENNNPVLNDLDWDFLAGKTTLPPTPSTNNNQEPPKPPKPTKTEKTTNPIKQPQLDILQSSIPQIKSQPQLEPQILPNATFNEVLQNSLSTTRKCLKLQPNILQHHINIDIQINNFKEITQENSGIINKLWKGTYILFNIKTVGRNKQKSIGISWEVQRQHSDFQWLRNMLIKMYPGIVVPPLPSAMKDLTQINGYIRKLVSFLADCENCKELKNSKYFQVFLSYGATKDFEGFKKSCETTSKPKNLSHIINMSGQLELLHSQKIESYSSGLQSFLTKTSQHLKNVKSIIGQIDDLYSQISNKYKQLSSMFTTMSQESCQFSNQQCYPKLTQTYKQISQLSTQHSYLCNSQKQFISTFMSSHFSYEKDRINNMQNLINKHKTFYTELNKPKHQSDKPVLQTGPSMFGKIANLFGEKTQSLDIPASDTATLRDQVGFYNSQLLKESIRCIDSMTSSHINHFSLYGHSRIDNIEEIQKMWSQILVDFSKLKV